MTRVDLTKYQRCSTIWGFLWGIWIAAALVIGVKLMFWSMFAFDATSFPKTLGPAALLFVIPAIAALPVRWFFIALARWYNLRCAGCRRVLHDHPSFVPEHAECPYCSAPLFEPRARPPAEPTP